MKRITLLVLLVLYFNIGLAMNIKNQTEIFLPESGSSENPIKLSFNAYSYGKKGIKIDLKKSADTKDLLLGNITLMYKSVYEGSLDTYLKFWKSSDRSKTSQFYDDNPSAWSQYVSLIKDAKIIRLMIGVGYGDYTIAQILFEQSNGMIYVETITLVNEQKGFSRTGDLSDDSFITFFKHLYKKQLIESYKK